MAPSIQSATPSFLWRQEGRQFSRSGCAFTPAFGRVGPILWPRWAQKLGTLQAQ